jgi:hypothetical protein
VQSQVGLPTQWAQVGAASRQFVSAGRAQEPGAQALRVTWKAAVAVRRLQEPQWKGEAVQSRPQWWWCPPSAQLFEAAHSAWAPQCCAPSAQEEEPRVRAPA